MDPKERAGAAAVDFVESGMVVGLGTGSTAEHFLRALGAVLRAGRIKTIRAVPTSNRSEQLARELGIPIVPFSELLQIDVDVDGADEIDPQFNLIKGMGGALLREKIVAQNAKRMIVIADTSKRVARLGTRSPVPVEVVPFGHELHEPFFRSLGCSAALRRGGGDPLVTDNGNFIYDCRFERIDDADALQAQLKSRAGVVETGLFLDLCDTAIIADANGHVEVLRRA